MSELKRWIPRPFQKEGVRLGISQACAGFLLRPGMGKTTIIYAIHVILKSKELIRRTLVIAPIKPMYNVWPKQCHDWAEFDGLDVVICHGKDRVKTLYELDHDIYVINPEGLEWLDDPAHLAHVKANFDVLVVDECFVGETLVLTPTGKRQIKDLRVGNEVMTSAGVKKILRTTHRKAKKLVNLVLSTGEQIVCTPNHPFFTDVGWICARDLDGHTIIHRSNLSSLQAAISGSNLQAEEHGEERAKASVLLEILRSEANAPRNATSATNDVRSGKDECGSSELEQGRGVSSRDEREVVGVGAGEKGSVPNSSWRKWNGHDLGREDPATAPADRVYMELPSVVGEEARRLSHKLQAGFCEPRDADWSGGRRSIAFETETLGPEERRETERVRVDRVEDIEHGDLPDVWNLEVADCPHYFVGVGEHLVHNSTKFKATGTQRFKRIRKFVKYFRRRYILTGSFTPNGLLDLFGQIYILDEGSSLGSYVSHYKTKYFYATDFMGYNLAPHPWAPKEIAEKIAPLTLVMEREGNIVMPELLPTHDIVVELPPAVRQQYEATWNSMLTLLESGDLIISKNAAVATSKCRQIANGFVFHDRDKDPGGWTDLHSAKIEALRELIDELSGEPLLVCYEFKPDLEKLQAAFPEACLLTSGNAKRDDEAISIFKAGMMKVALAQITSISLGIDGLQNNCYNVCMYAITWNLQDYSQAIDRVWRPGQTSGHVSVHRIITKDTVDERVLKVLNNKEAVQTDFLTLLKGART